MACAAPARLGTPGEIQTKTLSLLVVGSRTLCARVGVSGSILFPRLPEPRRQVSICRLHFSSTGILPITHPASSSFSAFFFACLIHYYFFFFHLLCSVFRGRYCGSKSASGGPHTALHAASPAYPKREFIFPEPLPTRGSREDRLFSVSNRDFLKVKKKKLGEKMKGWSKFC